MKSNAARFGIGVGLSFNPLQGVLSRAEIFIILIVSIRGRMKNKQPGSAHNVLQPGKKIVRLPLWQKFDGIEYQYNVKREHASG
ncbi:MAG: hypothetical protein ABFC73_12515 [Clostridiaceae bacterium]